MTEAVGIDHVVLMKVKPDTKKELIDKMCNGLQSLAILPGVISIVVGETYVQTGFDDRRGGYTHYLRVRVESDDALRNYQNNPNHVQVKKECIAPIVAEPPIAIDCAAPMVLGSSPSE